MKLLTSALVVILLTTASAKPIHSDADIADSDLKQGWLDENNRWNWRSSESSAQDSSDSSDSSESSESSESDSSESDSSEESSEEVFVTAQTIAPVMTTAAMTTMKDGDGLSPEPGSATTDDPTATETMPVATSTDVTRCVTVDILTFAPITENRGDN